MPGPSQPDVSDLQSELKDAQKQIKDLKDKLDKEPSSNDKGLLDAFLSSKLGFISKCMTGVGALTITTQELKDFREKMKANYANLKEKLKVLGGIVLDLAEELVDLLGDIGKTIVDVFEKIEEGVGKIRRLTATTAQLQGETKSLRLSFGPRFQRAGLPASLGPFAGTWTATVEQTGTDMQGNGLYRITEYECTADAVALGAVPLRSLRQALDVERVSTFTLAPDGTVTGVLHSRWTSASWPADDSPVLGTTTFTGRVTGDTFMYQSQGEDYVFLTHLFPELALQAAPKVVNSAGAVSTFDPKKFAGTLALDHNADASAARLLTDAVSAGLPKYTPVTTDQLRQVTELIHTNPYAAPAAAILAGKG
ncbi:MAG: hypothetical protein KGN76_04210 [Acidobacteriota bacterium]|nr:hypothetical protein [Acidobacteriota bacterium]